MSVSTRSIHDGLRTTLAAMAAFAAGKGWLPLEAWGNLWAAFVTLVLAVWPILGDSVDGDGYE
jgi:hypothetical protein